MEVTLHYPPIRKPATVKLIRKWSDWEAGDIITMDSEKAQRVIAKGYARLYVKEQITERCETATAEPLEQAEAEQAVVTPRRQSKKGPRFPRSGDSEGEKGV